MEKKNEEKGPTTTTAAELQALILVESELPTRRCRPVPTGCLMPFHLRISERTQDSVEAITM